MFLFDRLMDSNRQSFIFSLQATVHSSFTKSQQVLSEEERTAFDD